MVPNHTTRDTGRWRSPARPVEPIEANIQLDLPRARVRPDVVFTRAKVAVFVDGCFWHVCPVHGRQPTVNQPYWTPKLAGNMARDVRNTEALRDGGWCVLRFWEHESPELCADLIETAVRRGRTYLAEETRDAAANDV